MDAMGVDLLLVSLTFQSSNCKNAKGPELDICQLSKNRIPRAEKFSDTTGERSGGGTSNILGEYFTPDFF